MFLCRAAWRKLAPLARMSVSAFSRNVPARQMSSGGVPGSSGTNLIYVLLCGGSFTGAIYYSYKTLTSDKARFHDRVDEISTRPKDEWTPKPWPPKKDDAEPEEAEEAEAAGEPATETASEATGAEAVEEAVEETAKEAVLEASESTRAEAVEAAVEKTATEPAPEAAEGTTAEAVEEAVAEALEEPPSEAVSSEDEANGTTPAEEDVSHASPPVEETSPEPPATQASEAQVPVLELSNAMKTVSAVPMAEAVEIAAASVGEISSAAPALVQDATQQIVTLIQMSTQSPDQNVETSSVTKGVSLEKPNVITLISVSDKEASSQSPSPVAVEELDNTTADMGTVETAITPEAQAENKSSMIQDADKVQDATQQIVTLIQMSTQSPDQNVETSSVTKGVSLEKPNVITLVSVSDKEASSQSPSPVAVEELDNTTADIGAVETAITPEAQAENKSSMIQDADKAGIPSEETTVSPVEDTSEVSVERDTVLTLEFTAATSEEDVTEVLMESTHICPEEDSVVTTVEETTTATVEEQAGITQDSIVINAEVTAELTAVTPGEVLTGAAQEEVVVNLLGASEEAQEEKEVASAEEKMSHTPREVSVFALVAPAEEEAVTPAEADPVGVTARPLAVETGKGSKGKLTKDVPVRFVEQAEDAIEEAEAESAKRTALPVVLEAEVILVGGVIETEAIPAAGCAVPSAQEAAVAQVMERVGEIVALDIEAVESEHKADEMTSIPVETEVVEKTVSPVGVGVETEVTSEAKAVDNSAALEEKSPLAEEIILNHLEAEETFQEDKESRGADKSTGI